MKAKKSDIIVILTVALVVFGGFYLMKHKSLDADDAVRARAISTR